MRCQNYYIDKSCDLSTCSEISHLSYIMVMFLDLLVTDGVNSTVVSVPSNTDIYPRSACFIHRTTTVLTTGKLIIFHWCFIQSVSWKWWCLLPSQDSFNYDIECTQVWDSGGSAQRTLPTFSKRTFYFPSCRVFYWDLNLVGKKSCDP